MSANQHHLLSIKASIRSVIIVNLILFIPSSFAELDELSPVDLVDTTPNQSGNTNQTGIQAKSCSITLAEFVVYFYLQTIVCLLGVVLNLINVAVFRKPQFLGDAYLYMTAMSLADAITLLAYLPSGLVRCNRYFHYCHHSSFPKFRTIILYYNTYILYPIGNISENATVWFTVLLSVERYLAMRTLEVPSRTRRGSQVTASHPPPNGGSEAPPPPRDPDVIPGDMPNQVEPGNPLRSLNVALINRLSVCTHALQGYTSRANEGFLWMTNCRRVPAQILIATVAVLSILFNLPMCFVQTVGYRDDGVKNSSNDDNRSVTNLKLSVRLTSFGISWHYGVFSWFRTMLVYVIPFIFLCVANACLLHFVNSAGNRRQKVLMTRPQKSLPKASRSPEDHLPASKSKTGSRARWRSAQRKLTILLIIIIGLFLAGQIPQAFAYTTVFGALMSRFGIHCPDWQCCSPYQIYRAVTHLLSLLSYSINFFVYMFLNRHFQNQVCAWFTVCCCCCCHRHDVPQFNCPTSSAGALAQPRSQLQSSTNWGLPRPVLSQNSSNAQNFDSLKPEAGYNHRLMSMSVSGTSPSLGKTGEGVKSQQRRSSPPFLDKPGQQSRPERDKSNVSCWVRNRMDQISGSFRKTRERCTLHRNLSPQMNSSKNSWDRQIYRTCENPKSFGSTSRDGLMWLSESRCRQYRIDSTFPVQADNPQSVSYCETLAEAPPFAGLPLICQDADMDAISVDGSLDSRELNISTSV